MAVDIPGRHQLSAAVDGGDAGVAALQLRLRTHVGEHAPFRHEGAAADDARVRHRRAPVPAARAGTQLRYVFIEDRALPFLNAVGGLLLLRIEYCVHPFLSEAACPRPVPV